MILRNFALANKLQERIKAAAQHSSSELGSAFTLHFICIVNLESEKWMGQKNTEPTKEH